MSITSNRAAQQGGIDPSAAGSKVYEMVTKHFLQAMMRGEIPWRQTWKARKGKPPFTNHFTGKPYSLLNGMLLGEPGEYATIKQINEKGGFLKKGTRGKFVIYWGKFIPKDRKEEARRLEEDGKDTSHLEVRFPKYYYVYNIKDAEGLPAAAEEQEKEMVSAQDPTDIADMVVGDYTVNENVLVEEAEGLAPGYIPSEDKVTMPSRRDFTFEEDYYAALMEQLVHSTATEGRCDRKKEYERLRDADMSVKEELIAEIGSSMILSVAGMNRKETHEQIHAECQRWIEEMNRDYRLIVNASSGAEKAAKLILGEFAE